MADIKEEMSKIEKAYKGKEIKEAILSALDKVNETNGTARYLDGHGVSEFLSQEELNEILPLDSVPTEGSNKGIASGKIYSYLVNLAEVIDDVNVVENTSGGMDETIKEKLEYLNETKRKIRKEILDHDVPITESTPLTDYQYLIGLIEMRANLDVEPLEATENKVYEAPEGHAYNPVNVNVPFNLTIKPITKNGKYKASTDGVDGYSTVNVDGGSMVVQKNISSSDFPSEIKTVTYKAKDEGDDIIGYSQVSVDLSGKVLPEKPVTIAAEEAGEEYVYNAADDDVYGYGKFILSIRETKEAFTVQFISDGEAVYVETDVPKGGSCSYNGDALEKDGYIFAGWNPQPVNIVRDTKCIAQWEQEQKVMPGGGHSIDEMDWDDIMSHPDDIKGDGTDSKYIYWEPFVSCNQQFLGGRALATCRYKGEQGTNTSWTFDVNIADIIGNIGKPNEQSARLPCLGAGNNIATQSFGGPFDYTKSPIYSFANDLASAILACSDGRYGGQKNLSFASVPKYINRSEGRDEVFYPIQIELPGVWLLNPREYGRNNPATKDTKADAELGVHYAGLSWGNKTGPQRWLRQRSFNEASKADADKYEGINEGDLLTDQILMLGFGGYGTERGFAWECPYWYINPNQAYRDAVWEVNPSNPYKEIKAGYLGAGTLSTLKFGFCL